MTKHIFQVLHDPGTNLDSWREISPELCLWTLTVIACCIEDRSQEERALFVYQLQLIVFMEGLIYQTDLEEALRRIIFVDGALSGSLESLWKEINCGVFTGLDLDVDFDIDA